MVASLRPAKGSLGIHDVSDDGEFWFGAYGGGYHYSYLSRAGATASFLSTDRGSAALRRYPSAKEDPPDRNDRALKLTWQQTWRPRSAQSKCDAESEQAERHCRERQQHIDCSIRDLKFALPHLDRPLGASEKARVGLQCRRSCLAFAPYPPEKIGKEHRDEQEDAQYGERKHDITLPVNGRPRCHDEKDDEPDGGLVDQGMEARREVPGFPALSEMFVHGRSPAYASKNGLLTKSPCEHANITTMELSDGGFIKTGSYKVVQTG